jgi:CheY-like chemotaxis protein
MSIALAHRPLRVQIVGGCPAAADTFHRLVRSWEYDAYVDRSIVSALQTAFFFRPDVMLLNTEDSESVCSQHVVSEVRTIPELRAITLVEVSARRDRAHRDRSLAAGFDALLGRPIVPALLQALLKSRELVLIQKRLASDLLMLGTEQQRLLQELKAKVSGQSRQSG